MSPAPVFVQIPGSHHPGTRLLRTHTGAGDTVWQPILNLYSRTSTVYWCITSKLKVRYFFMEWIKRFSGCIYHFSISLTLVVLQRQKSLLDIGGITIPDVGHLTVMRVAMECGVHIMRDELVLQISCNLFLAIKWMLMMTSGQNISHYATAKLSVHVWNDDLIWWQNKSDPQKHFRKTTITNS